MGVSTDGWKCNIADDNLSATLLITPPLDGEVISRADIDLFLRKNGVKEGVLRSEADRIVNEGIYDKEITIARGRAPVEGKGGYYDFFFEMGPIKSPAIREDGSVDYQSMNVIHSVKKDEVLAVYHHAIPGSHGIDVKGRELRVKPVKELPDLKGSGFVREADNVTYKASMDGRVEYNNYKLYVRDIYELKGDLDLVTGRIDFRGDVVIHGNVETGTMIRASKSITIEGNVEGAVIIAEGDIVLKKGMQGGNRARVVAGGNIYAYFLEYTDVSAKGNIQANIILNCKVTAGGKIIVKGKKGFVVGGNYYAVSQIDTTSIGNPAEVRTICAVGIDNDLTKRNHELMVKQEAIKRGLDSALSQIDALSDVRITNEPKSVRDARINQIRRRIKRDERILEHIKSEIEEIRSIMDLGKNSKVTAEGNVYPGSVIKVDDKNTVITSIVSHVEFKKQSINGDIVMINKQ